MDLAAAAALCRQFEGLRLQPYACPAGVPTIGYGSTRYGDGRPVSLTDPAITAVQAESLLMQELVHGCAPSVARLCPPLFAAAVANNDWRAFNAAVDFTYNLGAGRLQSSTLRRKLNAGDRVGAREQLLLWVRGGGRVLPGLVKRRQAEAALL